MTDRPTDRLSPEDYSAIEAAVLETTRGRWFLAEHARRNRQAETEQLVGWLQRIEQAVARQGLAPPLAAAVDEGALTAVAQTIARARQEIAASIAEAAEGSEPRPETAFADLAAVVEKASAETYGAAEGVQEAAWTLRETGTAEAVADDLDRRALEIYRASSEQSLTASRVRTLIGMLHGIEARIQAMVGDIPGAGDLEGMSAVVADLPPAGAVTQAPPALPAPMLPEPEPPKPESPPMRPAQAAAAPVPSPFSGLQGLQVPDDIVFVERPLVERRRAGGEPEPVLPDLPAPDRGPDAGEPWSVRKPPAPREEAPLPPRARPFERLDALSAEDKIALFA